MSIPSATIEARARVAAPRSAVAWTADCSATVDLDRLSGPRHGVIDPPANLFSEMPKNDIKWNLDRREVKIRLYRACLMRGCAFDIYRWVNLTDLVILWNSLDLSSSVALPWERALRELGLLSSPDPALSARRAG